MCLLMVTSTMVTSSMVTSPMVSSPRSTLVKAGRGIDQNLSWFFTLNPVKSNRILHPCVWTWIWSQKSGDHVKDTAENTRDLSRSSACRALIPRRRSMKRSILGNFKRQREGGREAFDQQPCRRPSDPGRDFEPPSYLKRCCRCLLLRDRTFLHRRCLLSIWLFPELAPEPQLSVNSCHWMKDTWFMKQPLLLHFKWTNPLVKCIALDYTAHIGCCMNCQDRFLAKA